MADYNRVCKEILYQDNRRKTSDSTFKFVVQYKYVRKDFNTCLYFMSICIPILFHNNILSASLVNSAEMV